MDPRRTQRADSLREALAVHRAYLGHVDDARTQQVGLPSFEPHVARHRREHEIGGDGGNYGCLNVASIETVLLDNNCGSPARRLRALALEAKPVDLALPHHQVSSDQSVPAESTSSATRSCSAATAGL